MQIHTMQHSTAPVTAVSNWQWLLAEIAVSDPSLIWFRLRKLKLTQGNKTMKSIKVTSFISGVAMATNYYHV